MGQAFLICADFAGDSWIAPTMIWEDSDIDSRAAWPQAAVVYGDYFLAGWGHPALLSNLFGLQ